MNSDLYELFNFLKYKRENCVVNELSQRDVAFYIDISNAEISRIESYKRQNINITILFKFFSLYNLSNDQIINIYNYLLGKENLKIIDTIHTCKQHKIEIDEEIIKNLKNYFKNLRICNSLSQRDLEKYIGISSAEICRLETGVRNSYYLHTLIPLCKFYKISEEQVLDFYNKAIYCTNTKENDFSNLSKEELINYIYILQEENIKLRKLTKQK